MKCLKAGFPNLWDLMPDALRWISCNNNRNRVYNKCNVLESSPNHPPLPSVEKLFSTKLILVPKTLGTPAKEYTHTHTHTHTHTECITRFITSSGLKREKKKGMYRKQEKYLLFSDSSIFWAKGNVSRQNYFFYSNFMQILFTLVEILKRKNPPHTHQKAGDANKASILGVPILLPSSFFLPA